MALRTLITERQRRLGVELKKLRLQAGLSIAEGGKLIEMGAPHLSHIEAGRTAIPTDRLRGLVDAYGCKSEPYIDALVSMAESGGKGWWSAYRKSFPQFTLDLAELESRTAHLRSHETLLIPGLLQTESYMRALFRSSLPDASEDEIETAVRFRLARQEILASASVTFHAVIHEAALRISVGGPHVMRGQLTHLIRAAERPGTDIQILPFESGARAWFGTPFLILGPGVPGLETVVLEHPVESLRLDDDKSIAHYGKTFEGLSKSALPAVVTDRSPDRHEKRDSWGLIQHILYTY
ncbi:helix-turn-helix domain-containing protein [Streptomyces samsunensis]|uniref:helix-turn-helix domain-containing protein n=1 Tax=Streptomyces malaysiensis TaxID=92644 RepID=UPI00158323C2|nr:helix-turn-helix transcriptional regulator [Streptomyces samsunensis]NUH42475.1 helix-turn-helix domain-containing protein [Streptomyces samsunensis]